MQKIVLMSMLIIILQNGLHAGEDSNVKFRSQITEFLKSYQTIPSLNPLKTFDDWIAKIMVDNAQWKSLAEQLLTTIQKTKSIIIGLKSETYPYHEYATYRSTVLQDHINFLMDQHNQQFLALNKRFSVTKATVEGADQDLYNKIISELVPPTEGYIKQHKHEFFKSNVDTIIKNILGVSAASNLTTIDFSLFEKAFDTALKNLQKTQEYIDLLNAKGSEGLKEEFKTKPKEFQGIIAKKLGYGVNPTLTYLRIQHNQLQIIRDAYISIIDQLLNRTLSRPEETAIKTRRETFEKLKEKRDIDKSKLLQLKQRARESLGF
jgi:hypothetical protein